MPFVFNACCAFSDVPVVVMETAEKREDGTSCFTMTIKSIPDATYVEWGMKENNDNNVIKLNGDIEGFSGTSNALPHPVLVVKQNKIGNYRFQIEVKNFIGSCTKTLPGRISFLYVWLKTL